MRLKLDTNPYSDDMMHWDPDTRRYRLTKKALPNVEFDNEEEYNRETERISENFYDFLHYESLCSEHKEKQLDYILAKDMTLRPKILKAMRMFFKFDLSTNGGSDSIYYGLDDKTPKKLRETFLGYGLIRPGRFAFDIEFEEGDFDEAKEHKNPR